MFFFKLDIKKNLIILFVLRYALKIKIRQVQIDFLEKHIKKAISQYGKENLIIKPDCGFLPLKDTFGEKNGYEISISKVRNMVKALNNIK